MRCRLTQGMVVPLFRCSLPLCLCRCCFHQERTAKFTVKSVSIREQPWGRQILLVALTGWGQEDDKRRTREAGFDAHIVKPIDFIALEKLLATDERG